MAAELLLILLSANNPEGISMAITVVFEVFIVVIISAIKPFIGFDSPFPKIASIINIFSGSSKEKLFSVKKWMLTFFLGFWRNPVNIF